MWMEPWEIDVLSGALCARCTSVCLCIHRRLLGKKVELKLSYRRGEKVGKMFNQEMLCRCNFKVQDLGSCILSTE